MILKAIKKHILIMTFLALIFGQSCKKSNDKKEILKQEKIEKPSEVNKYKVSVLLKPVANSKASGNVVFKENNDEIKMMALVSNLIKGTYEMYITNNTDCNNLNEDINSHWNPTSQKHGKWGDKEGYHRGDIGELKADVLGNAMLSFTTSEWCLDCNDDKKNIIGKTLIVTQRDSSTSKNNSNIVFCCGLIEKKNN